MIRHLKILIIPVLILCFYLGVSSISIVEAVSPTVTYSTDWFPLQQMQWKQMVATTDGTIHLFVHVDNYGVDCGGSTLYGLLWFKSSDGATWTCDGQLFSGTSQAYYPSAVVDSNDNIFVTYSVLDSITGSDIFFRKITKGIGSNWTLGAEQVVLEGDANIGYGMSDIQVEDSNRLWLTARYYHSTGSKVQLYYSNDQSASPTWTQAFDTFDVVDTSSLHMSTILDYGSKIAVIYNKTASVGGTYLRTYNKGDSPTVWSAPWYVGSAVVFTAISDDDGYIYVLNHSSTGPIVTVVSERGRTGGSTSVIIPYQNYPNYPVSASLSTDGKNVWLAMIDLNSTLFYRYLPGKGYIRIAQLGMPMESMTGYFLNNPESSQGFVDKYWFYNGSTYLDDTVNAVDIGTVDTAGGRVIGDIAYFGKSEKFNGLSWYITSPGSGGTVAWEYWNGASWATLPMISSYNGGLINSSSGYLVFEAPSDWASTTVGLDVSGFYYIRYRITASYASTITGTQYSTSAPLRSVRTIPRILNSKLYIAWSEGDYDNPYTVVRSNSIMVDTSEPDESSYTEIDPPVIDYVDSFSFVSGTDENRDIIETSDGTLHWFLAGGAKKPITCGTSELSGLFWLTSVDDGDTWVCRQQIYNTTFFGYLDVATDSSGNVYLVFIDSVSSSKIIYIKLTKGIGENWSVSSPQEAIIDAVNDLYYPNLEIENGVRLWVSFAFLDSDTWDYEVQTYYSSSLSETPTWTLSMSPMSVPGSTGDHISNLVRFGGDKTGIVYSDDDNYLRFRYRNDTDSLSTWSAPMQISTATVDGWEFSAVGTSDGLVFVSWIDYASYTLYFSWYNGTTWSTPIQITNYVIDYSQIMTDGEKVYIATQFSLRDMPGVYVGLYPYAIEDFSETITPSQIYGRDLTFDKVWVYASSAWTDETVDAGSDSASDVTTITSVGDIIYVGSSEKFDSVRWARSTISLAGVGFWEYWNGSQWAKIKDMTNVFNVTLTNNGFFGFIPYDNWTPTSLNGEENAYYYIRVRVVTPFTTGLTLDTICPDMLVDFRVPEYVKNNKLYMLIYDSGYSTDRIRLASYSLGAEETVSITNLDTELSAIDVLTNLDVTVPSTLFKDVGRQVKIYDGVGVGKKLLAQVTVDLTTSQSWSGVGGDVDVVNKKSVTRGLSTAPGVSNQWKLYVPKGNGDNRVRVCLTGSVLADISTLCSPGVTLTDQDPSVSTVVSEGETYWEISDTAVAGAVSYNEPTEEILDEEGDDDDVTPVIWNEPDIVDELIPPVDAEESIPEVEEDIEEERSIPEKPDDTGSEIAAASTVAIIVGSLIVVITLFFLKLTSTGNSMYIHLFQLLSSLFGIGPLRDKNQSYGIVYDSVSKEPLSRAIVRVLDSAGKLITTVVTDIYGIFDIVLQTGRYKFTVDVNMYRFPSLVIKTDRDEPYENIYRGSLINHSIQEILNLSVPVDKIDRELLAESGATFKNMLKGIWNLLSILIFVLGFSTTIYSLINDPNIYIWILFVIYILFILLYAYLYIQSLRGYGVIRDIHGDILSGIEVGLYEQEFGTLYAKRVTDEKGRYRFIVPQGEYKLSILTSNYKVVDLGRELFEVNEGRIGIIKERMRLSYSNKA